MLYVDIPTLPELRALIAARADACVSIYIPTTPETQHVKASRIALANLAKTALGQLEEAGLDKRRRSALAEEFEALEADDAFWRLQAHSLAVLATPDNIRTYRLATKVAEAVEVSDRYHVKPLLRAMAFPQHAFVLALSEGEARLVEIFADAPAVTVRVPHLPKDAASAVGRASVNNLTQNTRLANAEGQKHLLRQYARQVDAALRAVLSGRDTPLVLAATSPLAGIYRAISTYPGLLPDAVPVSPGHLSDDALSAAARAALDSHYARELATARETYQQRLGQRRATNDLDEIARAATNGAVELVLVDIDHSVPGSVDATTGAIQRADHPSARSYDVVDEIAGRSILAGARFLGVRAADIPGGAHIAAILRYPI